MMKKQNINPNRSTDTCIYIQSSAKNQKPLHALDNKRLMEQLKQRNNLKQKGRKSSLTSCSRSQHNNYKPKFILKDITDNNVNSNRVKVNMATATAKTSANINKANHIKRHANNSKATVAIVNEFYPKQQQQEQLQSQSQSQARHDSQRRQQRQYFETNFNGDDDVDNDQGHDQDNSSGKCLWKQHSASEWYQYNQSQHHYTDDDNTFTTNSPISASLSVYSHHHQNQHNHQNHHQNISTTTNRSLSTKQQYAQQQHNRQYHPKQRASQRQAQQQQKYTVYSKPRRQSQQRNSKKQRKSFTQGRQRAQTQIQMKSQQHHYQQQQQELGNTGSFERLGAYSQFQEQQWQWKKANKVNKVNKQQKVQEQQLLSQYCDNDNVKELIIQSNNNSEVMPYNVDQQQLQQPRNDQPAATENYNNHLQEHPSKSNKTRSGFCKSKSKSRLQADHSVDLSLDQQRGKEAVNYKLKYLESKKQLQIRTAYFNQAIGLCKEVFKNMNSTLGENWLSKENGTRDKIINQSNGAESESESEMQQMQCEGAQNERDDLGDRVQWCRQQFSQLLGAFQILQDQFNE